jgi:hypothetical protein
MTESNAEFGMRNAELKFLTAQKICLRCRSVDFGVPFGYNAYHANEKY